MLKARACIRVFRSNAELFQDPWEVQFDDISLHRIIGEGAFGKVYSGKLLKETVEVGKGRKSMQRKTDKEQHQMKIGITVAVKMLQSMIWLCQGIITINMDKVLETTVQILIWANRKVAKIYHTILLVWYFHEIGVKLGSCLSSNNINIIYI